MQPTPPTSELTITSWVCYYGEGQLTDLDDYDLVVIDVGRNKDGSTNYDAGDVNHLTSQGRTVLTYLSIGTLEDWRWYHDHPVTVLEEVREWPGEQYVDCRDVRWHTLLLENVIPELLTKGVDGLYLDNIDVAKEYPDTRSGVVDLIRRIRERYPSIHLYSQNGLSVMEEIHPYLTAIAHEDVFSTLAWDEKRATLERLIHWQSQGFTIFTLDYTESPWKAWQIIQESSSYGFIPYVTSSVMQTSFQPHMWYEATTSVHEENQPRQPFE